MIKGSKQSQQAKQKMSISRKGRIPCHETTDTYKTKIKQLHGN
jgi:hypothetical protein